MAITYSYTMDDSSIEKGVVSIGKRSASIRKDMHSVAVSTLFQWGKTGDVAAACRRANAMLTQWDGAFAQKIVNWFGVHAGFTLNDENAFVYSADRTTLAPEAFQAAKAESMFDLTPDQAPKAYDLRKLVLDLIVKAENKRTKGLNDDDYAPLALITALKAGVAALEVEADANETI